eukprot:Sro1407_g269990.2  (666) ;mRNA; f:3342-5341
MGWKLTWTVWVLLGRVSCVLGQPLSAVVEVENGSLVRPVVTLRAAVIPTPPFALVDETNNNKQTIIGGYHKELVESLEEYALASNVFLQFVLENSPYPKYGDALRLIGTDCLAQNLSDAECNRYDLILGDYYVNPGRASRVNFLPPFIRTSISSIKVVGPKSRFANRDYTLLKDAEKDQVPVCATDGTYAQRVVQAKYPNATWVNCGPTMDQCLQSLLNETCVLYTADEHKLKARTVQNPMLQVTSENFQTQFFQWPASYRMADDVYQLLKQLLYTAVAQERLDQLYYKYFEIKTCPLGYAGTNCQDRCHPDHGVADKFGVCVCESQRWTGPDCATEVVEERNEIPTGIVVASAVMFVVNISVCIACAGWLYQNRNLTQVKLMQPFFLVLVLCGCAISSSTILAFLFQQDDPNDDSGDLVGACMVAPFLYSIGFCITFGTLFAKLRRVYILFSSAVNMRRYIVSSSETLACIGALVLIDGIILVTWTIVDPLTFQRQVVTEDIFGYPLESVGYCVSDHWAVFTGLIAALHLTLLLVGCWYVYLCKDIPNGLSDAKYVGIAMISNAQIFVIAVPVLIIVASTNPGTSVFVRNIVIFMNDLAVVLLIFGSLMYSVYSKSQSDQDAREVVQTALRDYRMSTRQGLSYAQDSDGSGPLGSLSNSTRSMAN